jgi:hypothetical protein
MKPIAHSFACLLLSAGILAGNDEAKTLEPYELMRKQLLEEVDRAWEEKVEEPVIPRIKLVEGTAFEFIQQLEDAIGEKETSPIVVAVPAAKLSDMRVQVDLKDVPLNVAMATLSEITKLRTSMRDGVWWVEHVEVLDGDLLTRSYRLTPEELKGIGLEFAAAAKPNEGHNVSRIGGAVWPGEGQGSMGSYSPTSETMIVRLPKKEVAELDALLLLRKAGYQGLQIKP